MVPEAAMESFDVVVIGSGVGGLTAAAILSKAGMSVCVLEKEPHEGGYLAGFRRKDFLFDTAIHWLNQYGPGGMVTRLFDALGEDHPRAVVQEKIRRYKGKGFDYLLTNQPDQLRDQLIADFPEDRDGIMRFFKAAKKIGSSLMEFNAVFLSDEVKSRWERIRGKGKLLRFILPFIPYVLYSGEKGLKKGLNKFFKNPKLHDLFSSESEIIGCMVPIGWAYYHDFQSPPKGGGQMIPHWLKHVVESFGNKVQFQCRVTEILLDGQTCTGVKYLNRRQEKEIRCKYVVAACDVEALYEKMLPAGAVPAKLKEKLRAAELYSSSVTISIALDCEPEALGFGEELVHLADEGLPFSAYTSGNPLTTEISILAPSARDKSLAAPGQGTLTIFMPATMAYMDNWKTVRDEQGNYHRNDAYKQLKEEIAATIIKRVEEQIAPGLSDHILFYDVATPVTHYRYTGNKDGTMMGARPGRTNMELKVAHYQTPVKNLLLGGHWAELGGGVPVAAKAGANAAFLIMKKETPTAYKALAAYMENKLELADLQKLDCLKTYTGHWERPLTPAEKASLKLIK